MKPNYYLSQINIYPIKSLSGISLESSEVQERGLKFDRRWMLVDKKNSFITQRRYPELALIKLKITKTKLILSHKVKKLGKLQIPLNELPPNKRKVIVWDDNVESLIYDNQVNEWFCQAISKEVKLVYMPDSVERKTSTKYYKESKNVSFADGYPFLVIGEKSLELLNAKLKIPIEMNRFRPNLVFRGGLAHNEDLWNRFSIGNTVFRVVKPCERCVITTVNPSTGTKGKEPLLTLSKYRIDNNKVLFGQNLISEKLGTVRVGDALKILKLKND